MTSNQWREKYLALLDEQEQLEKRAASLSDILRRLTTSLGAASAGLDPVLDGALVALKDKLRGAKGSAVFDQVLRLEQVVKEVSGRRSESHRRSVQALQLQLDQLATLSLPTKLHQQITQLQRALKQSEFSLAQMPQNLSQVCQLQRLALAAAQQPAQSLWQRLRGGRQLYIPGTMSQVPAPAQSESFAEDKTVTQSECIELDARPPESPPKDSPFSQEIPTAINSEPKTTAYLQGFQSRADTELALDQTFKSNESVTIDAALETIDSHSRVLPDSTLFSETEALSNSKILGGPKVLEDQNALGDVKAIGDPKAIGEECRLLLLDILSVLAPEVQQDTRYIQAQHRCQQPLMEDSLHQTLDDVFYLLTTRSDVTAISRYLSNVNHELQEICQRLGGDAERLRVERQSGESFGRRVEEQLGKMQHAVGQAGDLEVLKSTITEQISVIHVALDQFREQQSTQGAEELQTLMAKMRAIEAEALKNKQLLALERHRANHDSLTELPNRDGFNRRMEQEWQRFKRYGRPLSLAVIDVDHFKKLNDQFGHQTGDRVLRLLAKTMLKRLRLADFIARIGGEEFVVLLPETEVNDAFGVLDSVRCLVAESAFRFKQEPVSITFSCGLTQFRREDTPETAFARADAALYRAKDQGRNQSVVDEAPCG